MVAAPQATVMMAAAPQPAQPNVAPPQVHAAAPGVGCILDSGAAQPLMNQHERVLGSQPIPPLEISGRTAALIGVESCGYPFVNLVGGDGGELDHSNWRPRRLHKALPPQTLRSSWTLLILAVKLRMLLELKRGVLDACYTPGVRCPMPSKHTMFMPRHDGEI